MNNRGYEVNFEVSGPMAMFTRPDSGASFVSYPAPTFSAAKGMFEAVARLKSAFFRPTRVNICRPIRYQNYTTNYNGPRRKSNQITKGAPYQLATVVLVDVCYQVFGDVEAATESPGEHNHLHYLQEKFLRRLKQGRLHRTPVLGWGEFVPDYFGPLREGTRADEHINEHIPSMLMAVFDKPSEGAFQPQFKPAWIRNGVLRYDE